MARQENLTVIKGGLTRQRTKGAALKDTLYELLNGYVTSEKTVKPRPGTTLTETLNATTVGIVHFGGGFHTFAASSVSVPGGWTLHILKSPDDSSFTLSKIHFAEPFLGSLYVVAEFSDGNIYHYWLNTADDWVASTDYKVNDAVQPTTPNGFIYKARRLSDINPAWSANTPRSVNDVVEPTTANGFKYTVTDTIGPSPRSGPIEPTWPTKSGAIIVEDLDDENIGVSAPVPETPPTPAIPPDDIIDDDTTDRYPRPPWDLRDPPDD